MSSSEPVNLGLFELRSRIGGGGMAEVWRGVHHTDGVPVAVKLVTASKAREREKRESLRNEVRAMARLEHPGIVHVVDYGEIPDLVARQTDGRLPAGSPYLVLELMDGGTLESFGAASSWAQLELVLLALLDALAHAHARDVIHRDIKPSNVLLARGSGDRVSLKLSDFGIAWALESAVDGERELPAAGTPWYMAPEQILGEWRAQGPWTDIYAVGCLAWQLVTGGRLFGDLDRVRACRAHCFEQPPELASRIDVPEDFVEWLDIALAKRPAERFETAADAAYALLGLDAKKMRRATAVAPGRATVALPTIESDGTTIAMTAGEGLAWLKESTSGSSRDAPTVRDASKPAAPPEPRKRQSSRPPGRGGWSPPPFPGRWAREQPTDRRSTRLLGAGLGLYGLRPVPLADRRIQRDVLWTALGEVHAGRRPRAVILEGPAGYGKTRLARWLGHRARELGAATVLFATHDRGRGAIDGLSRMLLHHVRASGLEGEKLERRVSEALRELHDDADVPADAEQLASLLRPSPAGDGPDMLRVWKPAERYAVIGRFLARSSARRPALVVVDDAQWAPDAIAMVEHLLRTAGTAPLAVLAVLTVEAGALSEQPEAAAQLATLAGRRGVTRLEVGPLAPDDHEQLVSRLLGLESSVARVVEERTAGSPLFAVQLVGDWVQRGRLIVGEQGFRLRPGARAELPDDIHALWSERIDRLIASVPEEARADAEDALEVAALLGGDVMRREWRVACESAETTIPEGLEDALATRRLASAHIHGMAFEHGMLRESLERRARERGRFAHHHAACADMLEHLYGPNEPSIAERRARHLTHAERHEAALEPLLAAAVQRFVRSDFAEVQLLVSMREEALEILGVPRGELRWVEGWVRSGESYAVQGQLDRAERALRDAEESTVLVEDVPLLADVRWLRGGVAQKRGDLQRAIGLFGEALELRRTTDDRRGQAICVYGRAECRKLRGGLEDAAKGYREAYELFDAIGDEHGAARCLTGLADLECRSGRNLEGALARARTACAKLRGIHNRHSLAGALNGLGDIARAMGRMGDAEAHYREALAFFEELASAEAVFPQLNLALVLLEHARWDEAAEVFTNAMHVLAEAGREGYLVYVHAGLLPCVAVKGGWSAWENHCAEVHRVLADTGMVDGDVAMCLQLAGDHAASAGEHDRARRAYAMAMAQWERLGREERVTSVLEALSRVGS